jgi:hypothetical protein
LRYATVDQLRFLLIHSILQEDEQRDMAAVGDNNNDHHLHNTSYEKRKKKKKIIKSDIDGITDPKYIAHYLQYHETKARHDLHEVLQVYNGIYDKQLQDDFLWFIDEENKEFTDSNHHHNYQVSQEVSTVSGSGNTQ